VVFKKKNLKLLKTGQNTFTTGLEWTKKNTFPKISPLLLNPLIANME